jgi:hypothetical protein
MYLNIFKVPEKVNNLETNKNPQGPPERNICPANKYRTQSPLFLRNPDLNMRTPVDIVGKDPGEQKDNWLQCCPGPFS